MDISCENGIMRVTDIQFDPQLTLIDSAQVFHWKNVSEGEFGAVVGDRKIRLFQINNGFLLKDVRSEDL